MQSEKLLLNKLLIIDLIQMMNTETSSEKLNSHSTLISDYTQIILKALGFPKSYLYIISSLLMVTSNVYSLCYS